MALWKSVERKIAELIGGKRVPITGRQRGSAPDIDHPILSVEVKERQSLPDWIHDAMEQAKASNPGDKHNVVILHEKGRQHKDDYVIMSLHDLVNWVLFTERENERLRDELTAIYEQLETWRLK